MRNIVPDDVLFGVPQFQFLSSSVPHSLFHVPTSTVFSCLCLTCTCWSVEGHVTCRMYETMFSPPCYRLTNVNRLTFRHRASCLLGQAFHYSLENAFYIFNQQIYFII